MVKTVSFKDEYEKEMIKYLNDNGYLKGFSYYVKDLIRKDMNKLEHTEAKKEIIKKNRNSNFDF